MEEKRTVSSNNPFRAEIEQILRTHTRTRCAKVFLGMMQGLTDQEMAEASVADGNKVHPKRIASVRRSITSTLNDEHPNTKTQARMHAVLYRELLRYDISVELKQHAMTRLTQLQTIDPAIKLEPLGHVRLGSNMPQIFTRLSTSGVRLTPEDLEAIRRLMKPT